MALPRSCAKLLSVVVLFALSRLLGKKQTLQLTFFDYCVGISIGSIAAQWRGTTRPLIDAIIAMAVYASVSCLSLQHPKKPEPADVRGACVPPGEGGILFDNE